MHPDLWVEQESVPKWIKSPSDEVVLVKINAVKEFTKECFLTDSQWEQDEE